MTKWRVYASPVILGYWAAGTLAECHIFVTWREAYDFAHKRATTGCPR